MDLHCLSRKISTSRVYIRIDEFELDKNNIPKHIALIMDGNGRWAKERNLPRSMGHKAGVETIRRVITEADELGASNIITYWINIKLKNL